MHYHLAEVRIWKDIKGKTVSLASHLVMAGLDLATVPSLLRHKSLSMTLRYSHLAPYYMVKAVDLLDNDLTVKPNAHKLQTLAK